MKILHNQSGIVLVTVVVIIVTMTILAIALMSTTTSQVVATQHQIDRLKAEELAKGAHWYNYMNINTTGLTAMPPAVILDGKTYTPIIIAPGPPPGSGPNDTDQYDIRINY